MEEVKNEVLEEQVAGTEQTELAGQAVQPTQDGQAEPQEAPMTEEEKKKAKSKFTRNVVLMGAGFVLGYMIGRMIFVEMRFLAYVCGMAMSGIVAALYVRK